jgi:hypothetical protein
MSDNPEDSGQDPAGPSGRSEILAALLQAKGNMGSPKRTATNPHFGKKYAPLEEVIGATEPALNAVGIVSVQGVRRVHGEWTLECWLEHPESGQCLGPWHWPLMPDTRQQQALGSATTYARRYATQTICGVAGEDDTDAEGPSQRQQTTGKPAGQKSQQKPPERQQSGNLPTFRFGKFKDQPLIDGPDDYLEWYSGAVAKHADDPQKQEYRQANLTHLSEVNAALDAKRGNVGPPPEDDHPPPEAYEDDIPF